MLVQYYLRATLGAKGFFMLWLHKLPAASI
jgi:hypothetical protein